MLISLMVSLNFSQYAFFKLIVANIFCLAFYLTAVKSLLSSPAGLFFVEAFLLSLNYL